MVSQSYSAHHAERGHANDGLVRLEGPDGPVQRGHGGPGRVARHHRAAGREAAGRRRRQQADLPWRILYRSALLHTHVRRGADLSCLALQRRERR